MNCGNDEKIKSLSDMLIKKEEEIVALNEEIAKLQNIANDELVLIEKLETKEVYGKKGKIENIKETVVIEEGNRESH